MKAEAPRVCPAILLSIDDGDAVVCPSLWEAVLHAVAAIEVMWKTEGADILLESDFSPSAVVLYVELGRTA